MDSVLSSYWKSLPSLIVYIIFHLVLKRDGRAQSRDEQEIQSRLFTELLYVSWGRVPAEVLGGSCEAHLQIIQMAALQKCLWQREREGIVFEQKSREEHGSKRQSHRQKRCRPQLQLLAKGSSDGEREHIITGQFLSSSVCSYIAIILVRSSSDLSSSFS